MSSAEITSILNLIAVLIPIVEKGAVALVADISRLLSAIHSSTDATPEQLEQARALAKASDAAHDAAFKAYQDMAAVNG